MVFAPKPKPYDLILSPPNRPGVQGLGTPLGTPQTPPNCGEVLEHSDFSVLFFFYLTYSVSQGPWRIPPSLGFGLGLRGVGFRMPGFGRRESESVGFRV